MKVVVAAGGTGGHLYPALALVEYIKKQEPDSQFLFIGTKDRLESQVVPQLGYDYVGLNVKGLVGNPLKKAHAALLFVCSIGHAKKTIKKFVFVFPVVVLLIGVVAFFIVVPSIYGKVVSFFDWIFSDPQNIIDTLRDSNVILSKAYSIVGIRVFWWIWIASFAASLFAVGKQLHNVKEKDAVSVNAVLKNKEPYLMTQNVYELLRQIKTLSNSRKLDSLLHAVNRLKEKLYVESDFGYGNDAVIACENSIAGQLGFLTDAVGKLENNDCEERINAMNKAVMNINSLLQRRIELKRR